MEIKSADSRMFQSLFVNKINETDIVYLIQIVNDRFNIVIVTWSSFPSTSANNINHAKLSTRYHQHKTSDYYLRNSVQIWRMTAFVPPASLVLSSTSIGLVVFGVELAPLWTKRISPKNEATKHKYNLSLPAMISNEANLNWYFSVICYEILSVMN